MTMLASDRWRICLHEAGHAVTAMAFNGKTDGAIVFYDGGGLTQFYDVADWIAPYVTAAGRAAEILLDRFPIPELLPDAATGPMAVGDVLTLPVFQDAPEMAANLCKSADARDYGPTDDERLARWAISNRESDPDAWAPRVAFARRIAGKIVNRRADAIAAVASELFQRGTLSGSEVSAIFERFQNV